MRFSIFDLDNWREIGVTLARNKTRTFMTGFGIFWGTAILALCIGGGRGFEGMMRRNFEGFATNMGYLSSNVTTKPYMGYNKGRWWQLQEADIREIRRTIPEIDRSSTVQSVRATAKYGTKSNGTRVMGVEPDYWKVQPVTIYEGRLLNESDDASSRKAAIIGRNVAGQLFGDESPLGKFVQVDGLFFRIVGVAGQKTEVSIGGRVDDSIWLSGSTFRRAYSSNYGYGFFIYTTERGVTPTDLQPCIGRILRRNHLIAPDDMGAIDFGDISEMFEMVDNIFMGVNLLMLFVGFGTLLAGVIGVGNIMWIIVRERTNEIGIRRALGAKPRDIIVQILSESTVLTTVAGLAGVSLSAIILGVLDKATYDNWFGAAGFELKFGAALGILVTFLVLGTAAGLIPAIKAMNIKPIEAINSK